MDRPFQIEICCFGAEDVAAAFSGGADRAELCASALEGGLTPSPGLVASAQSQAPDFPLHLMIRPRGGDFLYSAADFAAMVADVRWAKTAGIAGVVFGILGPDGNLDVTRCGELAALAHPLPSTLHRAFDRSRNSLECMEMALDAGFSRILTSGLAPTALEGIEVLARLVESARGRIEIMAGGGVTDTNAEAFFSRGVRSLHSSCKVSVPSGMHYRNPQLEARPGDSDVKWHQRASEARVKALVQQSYRYFE